MLSTNELYRMANTDGFIRTMYSVFGNDVRISIPINEKYLSVDITELNLSVRSYNGLKRAGIFTLGDLFKALRENTLTSVRNLGKKSISEIKTKFLDFCYTQLSDKKKTEFLQKLIEMNSSVYKTN